MQTQSVTTPAVGVGIEGRIEENIWRKGVRWFIHLVSWRHESTSLNSNKDRRQEIYSRERSLSSSRHFRLSGSQSVGMQLVEDRIRLRISTLQKGVVRPWLAERKTPRAAVTQKLGAGLHTGDLNSPRSVQRDHETQLKQKEESQFLISYNEKLIDWVNATVKYFLVTFGQKTNQHNDNDVNFHA